MARPVNTQFTLSDPAQMAALERRVSQLQAPPHWFDRKGRPNSKNPNYRYNPANEYNDYREWVAGGGRQLPQDMVEQINQNRMAQGLQGFAEDPEQGRLNRLLQLRERLAQQRGRR